MAEIRTETMTVNMGPQHPSTHGVLRLVLELDGEVIQSVMPTIGYLHTGIEKTAEQKKWQQVIPLVERMDYLGPQSNSLAYALSVEKLLGRDRELAARGRLVPRARPRFAIARIDRHECRRLAGRRQSGRRRESGQTTHGVWDIGLGRIANDNELEIPLRLASSLGEQRVVILLAENRRKHLDG